MLRNNKASRKEGFSFKRGKERQTDTQRGRLTEKDTVKQKGKERERRRKKGETRERCPFCNNWYSISWET